LLTGVPLGGVSQAHAPDLSAEGTTRIGAEPALIAPWAASLLPSHTTRAALTSLEVFTNTWSYSTIGLVYDPSRSHVRYAHESQSSSHNPTVYDVDRLTHTVAYSFALSTQNPGWPWQLDNRTGAGYDPLADTYFLADYNGDLSYADDNIVEVDPAGNVLNAWEMDDEVNSNDSRDGSEIDSIIDIAVVPGDPPRYFATAAYDDNVVYEIALTKSGTLWTPNSWHTVATYTLPLWELTNDNLGIDYDAEYGRLYHSSWDTTTIMITDLEMNPVTEISPTFDCPGAGGYNSGVTFIEGSNPPQVWVTDFSSDQTTRCTVWEEPEPPAAWGKWVDGHPWTATLSVTTETSGTFQVTDVITSRLPFTLTERWDAAHLRLADVRVEPPPAVVEAAAGVMTFTSGSAAPDVVTVTKTFQARPCTWVETVVSETVHFESQAPQQRTFTVTKEPPVLEVTGPPAPVEVYAGSVASFTLSYGNFGGYENAASVVSQFPISATFLFALPPADAVSGARDRATWHVGDLMRDETGTIDVYALISETVPASQTMVVEARIHNHIGDLALQVPVELHANEPPPLDWEKWIDFAGPQPWSPGISLTLELSDTFVVTDVIDPPPANPDGFALTEIWHPHRLELLEARVEPPAYEAYAASLVSGTWGLIVPAFIDFGPVTVTKIFQTRPCTWTETVLWEETLVGTPPATQVSAIRPVLINKRPPELTIESTYEPEVYGGEQAQFVLEYANAGGLEDGVTIVNQFPPQAPFFSAEPAPTFGEPGDLAVTWALTEPLATGDTGRITVTVDITPGVPPDVPIVIWDDIYDHDGGLHDRTVITYHVPPPTWHRTVNGVAWTEGFTVSARAHEVLTVTDVLTTRSTTVLNGLWLTDELSLLGTWSSHGTVLSDTGVLTWSVPGGPPDTVTLTQWFRALPPQPTLEEQEFGEQPQPTDPATRLDGALWVEGHPFAVRPVQVERQWPFYLPLVMRQYATP
jgi:hypothetical protein